MAFRLTQLTGKTKREQRALIKGALLQAAGSPSEAAKVLGVSRIHFAQQMARHGIKGPRGRKE